MVLALVCLLVAALAGLVAGVLAVRAAHRSQPAGSAAGPPPPALTPVDAEALVRELQAQAAAERDAAVKAAVEQVVLLNREMVGREVDATRLDLDTRKSLIEAHLQEVRTDLRGELAHVRDLLGRLDAANQRSFGALQATLAAHADATTSLARTTQGLREALASPKARGQWGERMAEDVLRLAGFVEHVNYRKQTAVEGGRSIPDFTFPLPKGHVLYMDVKFPLSAYLRHLEATTDDERARTRAEFLRDVRLRVKELAKRDYLDASRPTVDELLLFIPNETVSAFIHEHDPGLVEDALRQKIVLCSPLTLFALLGVIRQAFDNFMIEQTSDEILRVLGAFHQQYERFTDTLERMGRGLATTQKAFDELNGTRRRQLEKPLQRLDDLRRERGLAAAPDLAPGASVVPLEPGDAATA